MDLILVRHAEKNIFSDRPPQDPELSVRGERQAQALVRRLQSFSTPRLWASPKKRAQQSLQPTADYFAHTLEIHEDLDERRDGESSALFHRRVQKVIHELENLPSSSTVICCSHLDWIEDFRTLLRCDEDLLGAPYAYWDPARYLILNRGEDGWSVTEFGRIE